MAKTFVFYHRNCFDGSLAAAIYMYYRNVPLVSSRPEFLVSADSQLFSFIPWDYDESIGEMSQYIDQHVVLLDISFFDNWMVDLSRVAASVLVIDHHPRAREQAGRLGGMDNVTFITDSDMNPQSGAQLTWNYLFHNTEQPDFVRWIGKGDRWDFGEDSIRPFRLGVAQLGFDPIAWKATFFDGYIIEHSVTRLLKDGEVLARSLEKQLHFLENHSTGWMVVDGYKVVCCNAPRFIASEIADRLLRRHTFEESPFVVIHSEEDGKLKYSMRARKGTAINLTEIANRFGGGGHESAASFSMQLHRSAIDPVAVFSDKVPTSRGEIQTLSPIRRKTPWWRKLFR